METIYHLPTSYRKSDRVNALRSEIRSLRNHKPRTRVLMAGVVAGCLVVGLTAAMS